MGSGISGLGMLFSLLIIIPSRLWSEFHSNHTRIDPTDLDGAGAGRVCTGPWYFQRRQVLVEGFLDCDPRVAEIKGVLLYAVQYCT